MATPVMAAGPHIHSGANGRKIMLDVIIALLPASAAAVYLFGLKALWILLTCVASAVASEYLFNLITRRQQSVGDLTAVVTGLLLGLNLSTNVPLWQCVIGSVFAIVVVKCLFGGLGHNFANPAITARVFMLLSFSAVAGGAAPRMVDAVSAATPLEQIASAPELLPSLGAMFLGLRGGAVGETCIAALLLGYVYLVARKVIRWYVPAAFVATVFVCSWIALGDVTGALYEILAGGLFLGAIFMATDYVTTPINDLGRLVFALGCGLITCAIRFWCAYPEGVSISILAMNLLTPYLEKWTRSKPLGGG